MFLSAAILLATTFTSPAWAQRNMAQCVAGFDWNRNSLGQDPCTIGSILDASCRGLMEYTYPPLTDSTEHYLSPRASHSGDVMCDCNTVMYSLYMSCASCQGGQVYSWAEWIPECSVVHISQYPANIPEGTAVPRWAYYDITSLPNQTWNESVAINIGQGPEELLKRVDSVTPPGSPTPDSPTPDSSTPSSPTPDSPPVTSSPGKVTTTFTTSTPVFTPMPTKNTIIKTPVGLTDPTIPANPTNPTDPAMPANPTDSTVPANPTTPTMPANPTSPTTPPNPTNPTNPANPTNPTNTNPTDPTNPTNPTDPTNTADSPGPMTPTDTANPSGPTIPNSKSSSSQSTSSTSGSRPTDSTGNSNTNSPSTNAGDAKDVADAWATVVVLFIWVLM